MIRTARLHRRHKYHNGPPFLPNVPALPPKTLFQIRPAQKSPYRSASGSSRPSVSPFAPTAPDNGHSGHFLKTWPPRIPFPSPGHTAPSFHPGNHRACCASRRRCPPQLLKTVPSTDAEYSPNPAAEVWPSCALPAAGPHSGNEHRRRPHIFQCGNTCPRPFAV